MVEGLISVVIPAYNCAPYIVQAVDSMLNQSYGNIEILIADDASTDDTKQVIDAMTDSRIRRFHNERNLGYLQSCNKLFDQARGSLLAFQDADDLSDPTRFEKQLAAMQADPEVAVVGSNLIRIDEQGNELERSDWPKDINESMTVLKMDLIPNSFLFKREVFEQIGGYHPYFDRIGFEDFYWTTLIVKQFKATNLPDHLYYYRSNESSITASFSDRSKRFSYWSLWYLWDEQMRLGTDYLKRKDVAGLKAKVYLKLSTEESERGDRSAAVRMAWKAVEQQPMVAFHWRTFLYHLRKSFNK